jgi:hypothetical protein
MDLYLGIAVVIATLLGPVLAVYVTRKIDEARAEKARKLEIFRALMRTRKAGLSPDHVNALNLTEIEFHGVPDVLSAYNTLMRHINTGPVTDKWLEQHRSSLTKLLSAITSATRSNSSTCWKAVTTHRVGEQLKNSNWRCASD